MEPPTKFLIEHRKIVSYLLDVSHPDGGEKAKFFLRHGFALSDVPEFARRILAHPGAADCRLVKVDKDAYAPKFVYEGLLLCPDGSTTYLRSVWELKKADTHGRLVTAYP